MGFRSRENHGNFSWAPDVWVFAGEAPCGVTSQKSELAASLGSVVFVVGLRAATIAVAAVIASRIRSFTFAVTM